MHEPNDVPVDRVCISFNEATNWIAFCDFGGAAIGPQRIFSVLSKETPESDWVYKGRKELAFELLLEYAAQGKIRLYAGSHTKYETEEDEEEKTIHVVAVPPEFTANAYAEFDEAEDRPTSIINIVTPYDEEGEHEHYTHIVVDYEDLISHFWGRFAKSNNAALREGAAPEAVHSKYTRRANRRSRPMKHKWSELTAATVERCLQEPITKQEDLVRKMLEWCAENWGEEPSLSDVRAYVAPIFQQFAAHRSEAGSTGLAEKSESEAEHVMAVDFRHEI